MVTNFFRLRSFLLWLLVLLLIGGTAFFLGSAAAYCALLLVFFLPAVSAAFCLAGRRKITVRIRLPLTSAKKTALSGRLTVRAGSRFPIREASVLLHFENALTGEAKSLPLSVSLVPGGTSEVSFSLTPAYCGTVLASVSRILVFDWFGFLTVPVPSETFSSLPSAKCTILPGLFDLSGRPPRSSGQRSAEDQLYPKKGPEDPSEVFSLREYRPGDPVRQIHWKLTAKTGTPVLREPSDPVEHELLLVWDKAPAASPDDGPSQGQRRAAIADALAEAFSSYAVALASFGMPFTALWSDGDGIRSESVTSEEDCLEMIPLMLKTGPDPDFAAHLADEEVTALLRRHGSILWFGAAYPFEAEDALPPDTLLLLCGDRDVPAGDLLVVRFPPEETEDVLRAVIP